MSKTFREQIIGLGFQPSKPELKPTPKTKTDSGGYKAQGAKSERRLKKKNQKKDGKHRSKSSKKWGSASSLSVAAISSAYQTNTPSHERRKKDLVSEVPTPVLEFPLSAEAGWQPTLDSARLLKPKNSGVAQSLHFSGNFEDQEQINVGFDFGTSAVKVMLRTSDGNLLPVPFTASLNNPYVLPSCIWIRGNTASLEGGDGFEAFRDLKLSLMNSPGNSQAIVHTAIFLSLALRQVRGWFYDHYGEIYRGKHLVWEVNFGIPAALHDQSHIRQSFSDLFELACMVSSLPGRYCELVSLSEVYQLYDQRSWESDEYESRRQTLIHLVPEIAAQIFGVFKSDSWDRSNYLMAVADVGAGTVDMGVFSISGDRLNPRLNFLKTSVKANGVVNLHRHRVARMLEVQSNATDSVRNYFTSLQKVSDINRPIPCHWSEYLAGSRILQGEFVPDEEFERKRHSSHVMQLLEDTKKNRYKNRMEWKSLPVLVCGGGGSEGLYSKVFKQHNSYGIACRQVPLILPQKARASGLNEETYRRLSLAYGLSFPFDLYPELVEESQIPDQDYPDPSDKTGQQADMITKDMV